MNRRLNPGRDVVLLAEEQLLLANMPLCECNRAVYWNPGIVINSNSNAMPFSLARSFNVLLLQRAAAPLGIIVGHRHNCNFTVIALLSVLRSEVGDVLRRTLLLDGKHLFLSFGNENRFLLPEFTNRFCDSIPECVFPRRQQQ